MLPNLQKNEIFPEHTIEDTYFLDRDLAYETALAHNIITSPSGEKRAQFCYYDGAEFENAPDNLISIPATRFTEIFTQVPLVLPTAYDTRIDNLDNSDDGKLQSKFVALSAAVKALRKTREHTRDWDSFHDSFFIDPKMAYDTAILRNAVKLDYPGSRGLQLCYYDGEKIIDAPDNLIQVPLDSLLDYFSNTKFRPPTAIVYPQVIEQEEKTNVTQTFQELLSAAQTRRAEISKIIFEECKNICPAFNSDEPLRVYIATSIYKKTEQKSLQLLALALERAGCEVRLFQESNSMENLDSPWILKEHLDFNPHVTINLNAINNAWLHPDVFNITWWQDSLDDTLNEQSLAWRDRDIALSAKPKLDALLEKTGATAIHRQDCCIDTSVYTSRPEIERKNRVVFVGACPTPSLQSVPENIRKGVRSLEKHLLNGEPLTEQLVRKIAKLCGTNFQYLRDKLLSDVVRDNVVRWLCQTDDVDVDVYGKYWEEDSVAKAHYRGEPENEEEIAKIYNAAEYAVVVSPHTINSRQLAEIAACGCIPVVYDCRHLAEQPHWDDECLFFTTKEQLAECLTQVPEGNALLIPEYNTYDKAAEKIVALVNGRSKASQKKEPLNSR